MKPRRFLGVLVLLVLVALFVAPAETYATELRATACFDWMFALRGGLQFRMGRYFGLQTSLGTNVQMLVADLTAVIYLFPPEDRWQVKMLIGIPNASVPLSFDSGFVSFGGGIGISRRFASGRALELRVGEGFPFFFEEGKETIRDLDFPFGLWPDLAIGVSFPLN